jgi:2-oxoglutarate ferredoxin oxidoreductase subunit alpha
MTEKVVIPPADKIEITPRRITSRKPGDFQLYEPREDQVPDMVEAGEGYRFHITGLTHSENGYPSMTVKSQDKLVKRLASKIRSNVEKIELNEETDIENADVVVVAYGITSRVAMRAIQIVRERGYKVNNRKVRVGMFRLITAWPFPDERINQIASRIRGFVVPELNLGQMCREVQRSANGQAVTVPVLHAGGTVHDPEAIVEAILEAAK